MTIMLPTIDDTLRYAERGYNVEADLITQTVDGRDLNDLWSEFQAAIDLVNAERQTLIDFLTFSVTEPVEDVPTFGSADFEEASEFGEPEGQRAAVAYTSHGYDFRWYDLATRYTWKYLAEATASQLQALHSQALEADNRLIFNKVMFTLFSNVNRTYKGVRVVALYNADGTVPPPVAGQTFDGTHTHYMVSGSGTVDPTDLQDLIDNVEEHGHTPKNGSQLVVLVNKQEGRVIRGFRAGTNNSLFDFIPALGQPATILEPGTAFLGQQAPSSVGGLTVIGSYGDALIVEEEYIPAGYMVAIATGGRASLGNPVGFREHDNVSLRGLRQIPGSTARYPLIDSYYSRGFGTGIRHRSGAAVMQIKSSGSYDVPTAFANVR